MNLRNELLAGKLIYKIQLGAMRKNMNEMEYIEWLVEQDSKVPLKTFAREYEGRVQDLANSLGVTRDTVCKWRSGAIAKCSHEVGLKIEEQYMTKVPMLA